MRGWGLGLTQRLILGLGIRVPFGVCHCCQYLGDGYSILLNKVLHKGLLVGFGFRVETAFLRLTKQPQKP